eukprot:COSAG02_NODE_10047_length_2038_cov_4.968025_2_plen_333_part_01
MRATAAILLISLGVVAGQTVDLCWRTFATADCTGASNDIFVPSGTDQNACTAGSTEYYAHLDVDPSEANMYFYTSEAECLSRSNRMDKVELEAWQVGRPETCELVQPGVGDTWSAFSVQASEGDCSAPYPSSADDLSMCFRTFSTSDCTGASNEFDVPSGTNRPCIAGSTGNWGEPRQRYEWDFATGELSMTYVEMRMYHTAGCEWANIMGTAERFTSLPGACSHIQPADGDSWSEYWVTASAGRCEELAPIDCDETIADRSTCTEVGQELYTLTTAAANGGAACTGTSTLCGAGDGTIPAGQTVDLCWRTFATADCTGASNDIFVPSGTDQN